MLKNSKNTHPPSGSLWPSLGACYSSGSNHRRNGVLAPFYCLLPHPPLLTKAPKVITMKKWVSITPTLTMFSKNEDNKHKSLHSKQELSAFNAKKKKKLKTEILRPILLILHMSWNSLPICKALGAKRQLACQRLPPERPDLCITAEAVGVFLFGGYIQTHPRLKSFYTYIYKKASYSFLGETTSSTSGSWMPTLVPLSLLEDEDSRDFLEAKDTPLPCNLPASSSLPVTS